MAVSRATLLADFLEIGGIPYRFGERREPPLHAITPPVSALVVSSKQRLVVFSPYGFTSPPFYSDWFSPHLRPSFRVLPIHATAGNGGQAAVVHATPCRKAFKFFHFLPFL